MNKTIKIIDLLNKIANGEEPSKKIKYDGRLYHLNVFKNNYFDDLDCSFIDFKNIHDTVEIIEDNDKLEKIKITGEQIKTFYDGDSHFIRTNRKDRHLYIPTLNKIINHINKIEEKLDGK